MIDFGLSKRYKCPKTGEHILYKQKNENDIIIIIMMMLCECIFDPTCVWESYIRIIVLSTTTLITVSIDIINVKIDHDII